MGEGRRVRARLWAAVLVVTVLSVASRAEAGAAGAGAGPEPGPLLGVYYGNQGWAMADVRALEAWQGRRHAVVEVFTDWNGSRKTMDNLFRHQLPNVWGNGNVPLVTWEPFTSKRTPADVEVRIARGDHDGYVTAWAARLAGFLAGADGHLGTADDRRAYLRLGHEPNGDWYPWGAAAGRNRPADYVAMWRRVHGLVRAAGLGPDVVQWVWAVNAEDVGGYAAEAFYPADEYVDWVAVDGYNWGTSESWSSWRNPEAVLGPMVSRLRQLAAGKPLAVTEVASASSTASGADVAAKSTWIADLHAWAPANGVGLLVWFNEDKEADWAAFGGARGDETYRYGRTTYRAYAAYREGVGTGGYVGSDPANPRLLTDEQFTGGGPASGTG